MRDILLTAVCLLPISCVERTVKDIMDDGDYRYWRYSRADRWDELYFFDNEGNWSIFNGYINEPLTQYLIFREFYSGDEIMYKEWKIMNDSTIIFDREQHNISIINDTTVILKYIERHKNYADTLHAVPNEIIPPNFRKKLKEKSRSDINDLPVIAVLTDVYIDYHESPEPHEEAEFTGTLYLHFSLSDFNDEPAYIPIYNSFRDSMYKSNIEIYLKGKKLNTYNVHDIIYRKGGTRFLDIEISDTNDMNLYERFEDVIPYLEFRYEKKESDTICNKTKIGDIKFVIDNPLIMDRKPLKE